MAIAVRQGHAPGMVNSCARDGARMCIAAIGILGLAVQYAALVGDTIDVVEATSRFLCYFTYWTNAIAALSMLLPVWLPNGRLGRFLSRPSIRAIVTANLIIVGTVYHVVLREPFELTWSSQADVLLHYITPALYLADWLLSVPRTRLSWHTATSSLPGPIAYGAWVFGYGAITHWYPYTFMELPTLGIAETLLNLLCLLSVFVMVTALLVLVDRADPLARAMASEKRLRRFPHTRWPGNLQMRRLQVSSWS